MKKILNVTLLALSLVISSCGSSKKQSNAESNDNYPDTEVSESGLVLRGNSDAGTAGGLRTVYFAYDSSILSSQAKSTLASNVEFLSSNGNVKITVEGHADERGGREYNLALGQKRAKGVRDYLVSKGIDSSRIKVVSYGKEQPLEFGHDESAWSKNRRASFFVDAL